jgi:hypothetical protein
MSFTECRVTNFHFNIFEKNLSKKNIFLENEKIFQTATNFGGLNTKKDRRFLKYVKNIKLFVKRPSLFLAMAGNSSDSDYFQGVFENRVSKFLFVSFSSTGLLVS